SRDLVVGADADASLSIARQVSAALVQTVEAITAARRPAFVVAKGGITSSDIATEALGIRRAWVCGTLLPGIASVWQPEPGPSTGIPYLVVAGNVGDDDALADALDLLRSRCPTVQSPTLRIPMTDLPQPPSAADTAETPRVAVIGLGVMGLAM